MYLKNSFFTKRNSGLRGDASYEYDADDFLTTRTVGSNVTTYVYSSRGDHYSAGLPSAHLSNMSMTLWAGASPKRLTVRLLKNTSGPG